MERYHFFASSCHQFGFNCKSPSELKNDESETDGALATVLEVLKLIHKMFFAELEANLVDREVRQMTEDLGATCWTELDPSVTHVVSTDAGTEKSRWAVKHKKFLVHPRWIEAANYLWKKQPEENFTVNQIKNP